jgi:hypothetical protein
MMELSMSASTPNTAAPTRRSKLQPCPAGADSLLLLLLLLPPALLLSVAAVAGTVCVDSSSAAVDAGNPACSARLPNR